MALEIRPNAIDQASGHFNFPGIYIGPGPYPVSVSGLRIEGAGLTFVGAQNITTTAGDLTINPSGGVSFADNNIINVGSIDLDLIRADATDGSVTIELDNAAGADLLVGNNNALVVEGNTDRVGIGTAAPGGLLDIVNDGGTADMRIGSYSDTATHRGTVSILHARGSEASPTAIQSGDDVGRITAFGHDGSAFAQGTIVRTTTSEIWSGTNHGCRLRFYTVPNASTTSTERFRIDEDGGIYAYALLGAAASTDVNINGSNELHSVTSSLRFKTKIRGLALDSSKIYDLKPRSFVWKKRSGNPGMEDFGLIAEEAHQIIPEIVNLDGEGKPYSIRSGLLPILMLAELQKIEKRMRVLEAA